MPSIRGIKLTIGGPEGTPGVAVARTHVIPIRDVSDLDRQAEMQEDPAIVGSYMSTGSYVMADNVGGKIPLAFRPVGGIGKILKSLLGTESTPAQIGACIRVRYTGASASCKLIANTTTDTLVSQIGALGSESNDASFGTAGSIDLTAVAYDTVGELVAYIEGLANYECEKIEGADACLSNLIVTKTGQAANGWCYLFFTSVASTVYERHFTPDFTSAQRPTYSIQKDGYQDNFLYAGVVVDTFDLNGKLKAMVEADCSAFGFTEAIGQTASVLTLADVDPMPFWNGSLSIGASEFPFVRDFKVSVKNGHNAEGYGQGSIGRQYHDKGDFSITGEMTVRMDADAYAKRASIFSSSRMAISAFYRGKEIVAGSNIHEFALVEIPFCNLEDYDPVPNSGAFDVKLVFSGKYPKGTTYDQPITITFFGTESAAF